MAICNLNGKRQRALNPLVREIWTKIFDKVLTNVDLKINNDDMTINSKRFMVIA